MVMLAAGSGRDTSVQVKTTVSEVLLRFAYLHSQLLVCKVNKMVFILNSDIFFSIKLEECVTTGCTCLK